MWWPVTTPTTIDLLDVLALAEDDVWAVGMYGTILHWGGSAWTTTPIGSSIHLYGVGGTSATDVWVVGSSDTILHWTGGPFWEYASSGSGTTAMLREIWSTSPTDVWVVGSVTLPSYASYGLILHGDGTSWTAAPGLVSGSLTGVGGSGPDDVWAVGPSGILHREP
jgi:hypothetical protein